MDDRLKTSRKGFAMKINMRQIFVGVRLLVRLCLPATVFIGLCTGMLIAFGAFLRTFSQPYPFIIVGVSWLSLLIFYIIFGVAFTRFNARLIHSSFESAELRVQRLMGTLSGLPFCALSLLCLMNGILCILYPESDMVNAQVFVSAAGFLGFTLVSLSYLLLIRFFLGRSAAIAHQ